MNREFLGHLFSLLLLLKHHGVAHRSTPLLYERVNDNSGALAWAASHKCSSLGSLFAGLAVSQLHLLTNIWLTHSSYLAGVDMGDIDAMSRLETHIDEGKSSSEACPTLLPSLFLPLDNSPTVLKLFVTCMPTALPPPDHSQYHFLFSQIHEIIACILSEI